MGGTLSFIAEEFGASTIGWLPVVSFEIRMIFQKLANVTFLHPGKHARDSIGEERKQEVICPALTDLQVCPFVGYLQDLFGKRYIALFGALLICLGCVVLGTAHTIGPGLVGMALAGAGAGTGG